MWKSINHTCISLYFLFHYGWQVIIPGTSPHSSSWTENWNKHTVNIMYWNLRSTMFIYKSRTNNHLRFLVIGTMLQQLMEFRMLKSRTIKVHSHFLERFLTGGNIHRIVPRFQFGWNYLVWQTNLFACEKSFQVEWASGHNRAKRPEGMYEGSTERKEMRMSKSQIRSHSKQQKHNHTQWTSTYTCEIWRHRRSYPETATGGPVV